MLTPSASRTSAAPHLLLAALFPCFATGIPPALITIAEVVEILKEFEETVGKERIEIGK